MAPVRDRGLTPRSRTDNPNQRTRQADGTAEARRPENETPAALRDLVCIG
jgi:hypothetical protein